MPETRTKHFANIEYDEAAVLKFPAGLPAFDDQRRFLLIEPAATAPIVFLQSLDDEQVCLPAVPVRAVDPDYELELNPDDLDALEVDPSEALTKGGSLGCLAVIAAPDDGPVTANLAAPVVINFSAKRAVQAVRGDTRYSFARPIVPAAAPVKPEEVSCW